ncbi:MAG: DUF4982 domain-containing protein [Lachnospiraceae bacterium]|nr:DUF4982 domain-containing protein [Lachnospiraceae bacterium]
MERKTLFNDQWKMKLLEYKEENLCLPEEPFDGFEPVTVPNDALIGNSYELYRDCILWYMRPLSFTPDPDKRYFLYFEGVYMDSSVYVNGKKAGDWAYGYTSFSFEITDLVSKPDDRIFVGIRHKSPNTRWYGGPGINRNVFLYEVPKTFIALDSLYIHTDKPDNEYQVRVSFEVDSSEKETGDLESVYEILDPEGESVYLSPRIPVYTDGPGVMMIMGLKDVSEWSPKSPVLYRMRIALYENGVLTDKTESTFGFRTVLFTTDRGFFLNGEHIKLKGVCLHTDGGCIGMAFHRDMAKKQLLLMKEMGANAIRFAHNPPAPEFLDLCDEYGMLVMDEAFDCWRTSKTEFDYARFFDEWHEKDMESFVKRDRNHPCVIMWSIGNEIYDTHKDAEEGAKTTAKLMELVYRFDPSNNAYPTLCSNYMSWENTQRSADVIKLIGYNYTERLYEEHHRAHPDWIIFGSETCSCVQSRGIYHFPLSKPMLCDADEQCSSLGNSTTSWGAPDHDFCISTERDTDFSLGQFLWAGIDYLGEPTPYHTKNSYLGICDTALFPKDAYYLYQAEWADPVKPVIHLLPYWDFNEGQMIDVRISSNAGMTELFLNGRSCGKKTIDHSHGRSFYADYRIPYEKGELKAVSYDKNGEVLLETKESSFGEVKTLLLIKDGMTSKEGTPVLEWESEKGADHLYFVEINGLDEYGREVRNANRRVHVRVTGAGYLYGIDNGDSTDYDSFKGTSKRMFGGKLLAVIRSDKEGGTIRVEASLDEKDIPVRKIELQREEEGILTPDDNDRKVAVKVLPEIAKDPDIRFEITNEAGVMIGNAVIIRDESEPGLLTIRAKGDGPFYLRALSLENGKVKVISTLDFEASGFGSLILDPYEFVSGSLYTESGGEIGTGIENGICIMPLSDSFIAFENLDFKSGSDEVTIPFFELESRPFDITFYEGIPGKEGSRIIGHGTFDKKMIWNVYQEETFKLDHRLKGVTTFAIGIKDHKTHIKGFRFTKADTAFEERSATEADGIYGDSFRIEKDAVCGITNNVSLIFEDMDFKEEGTDRILITGHTKLPNNSIHMIFENGNEKRHEVFEFRGTDNYVSKEFGFSPIRGSGKLTFLFLPGSEFDFQSFRFYKKEQ